MAIDAEFDDLIGAIYDAVVDKSLWTDAIDRIRRRFDFEVAALTVHALPQASLVVQATANIPPEFLERASKYSKEIVELWGGPARMAQLPLEEPIRNSDVTGPETWEKNRFYLEWARPLHIVDQVAIQLARDRMLTSALALSVHERRRPVTEADIDELRRLVPHLRRAVIISRMLDVAVDTATTFSAALEAIPTAVFLVDAGLQIVHANVPAQTMLAAGDPVRSSRGRLGLREELIAGQLQRAIEDAGRNEASLGRRGMAIPMRRLDGTAAAASIFPLERRRLRGGPEGAATAAIFVADPADPPSMPADALRLLYDLTPAEQRVFGLVVDGRRTEEIAKQLQVGVGTVRTQLLRVFEKTGRRTRADLVRLSKSLSAPG